MVKATFVLLVTSALIANCCGSLKVGLSRNNDIDYEAGFEAYVGQFAWYAHIEGYLESNYLAIVCGGSIISSNWVMTEAFCGGTSSSWHLYFGKTSYSQSLDSSEAIITNQFIKHPLYNQPEFLDNNIGLIQSSRNIELTMWVEAITLPWAAFNEAYISTYYVGTRLNDTDLISNLRWNFVQIISDERCSTFTQTNKGNILCTLGTATNDIQSPCGLNDGSALAFVSNNSYIQIGIGSWPSCRSDTPGQFTRVSSYLDWISAVTGISN